MSDTVVITIVDSSLIGKSGGIRKPLQTATPTSSAEGIKSVMFTYRFMEDQPAVFHDNVQGSDAMACAGDRACSDKELSAGTVPQIDEDQEVLAYADVCPEAQLMAGISSVVYLNDDDEGPVARLLQWVAGICGGFAVHASSEAQLMANNPAIYQNGLVQWLLR